MEKMNELDSIFNQESELIIGGKTIKINTVGMGDIPAIVGIVTKVYDMMPALQNKDKRNAAIIKFIQNDFESVNILLSVTTDLKKEEIKKLNPAAGALIIAKVIKENASFFAQHVAPILAEAAESAKKEVGTSKSKS